jgi:hypothetical protein
MRLAGAVAAALTAALLAGGVAGSPAQAADGTLSGTTGVGLHNIYDQAQFPYFANGLASGAGLVEVDVWTDTLFGRKRWRVSHDNPLGSVNNCTGQGATGNRNQDLGGCLDDIKLWHNSDPDHAPIVVKVEMKNGYNETYGMGPDDLDALIASKLGGIVYRPVDLLTKADGSRFPNLDAAAQADNWASRDALAGKVIFEIIPGTFEQQNPFDKYWTDREYATYLRNLAVAGTIDRAQIFPAVLGSAAGDPRTRYADATLRPWFVVFDGSAPSYLQNGIDTAWYDARHYLLVMTDAHNVAPAISGTAPTEQQARDRAALLAARHASYLTSDWSRLPAVLSLVLPRGTP